jgi:hypothetical protein
MVHRGTDRGRRQIGSLRDSSVDAHRHVYLFWFQRREEQRMASVHSTR